MSFQQSMKGRARLRGAEAIGHIGVQAAAEGARLAAWAAQDAAQAAQQAAAAAAKAERTAADANGGASAVVGPPPTYFIRDDDCRTRRLFAQEFVTQLKRLGAGNARQLYDDGMSFFACRPQDRGAIDHIGKMAQRYGWAEQTDGVWAVTEAGSGLAPPPSLAVHQVLTRIFSFADPVKTEAKDWVPLIAVVVGATASATAIQGFGTLDVIRVLALAVLVASVGIQFWGECRIVRAFSHWRRPPTWTTKEGKRRSNDFYSWKRLIVNAIFDLAVIAAFALVIFWQPIPLPNVTIAGTTIRPWLWTALLLGVVILSSLLILQFRWRRRRHEYVDARRLDTRLGWRAKARNA